MKRHYGQFSKALALISVIFFLAGCAGGGAVQLSETDKKAIKSITIDPEIKQPEEPFIQGGGNFKAFLLGGGIGAASEQKKASKIFKAYMKKNNINIAEIAHNEFKKVIVEENIFTMEDDSDVKLTLTINTYGFGKAGSVFALSTRRPLINITASLIRNGTDTIWQKKDYITNLSKLTDAYTYDQLAENPELTRKSFEQATNILARKILSDLKNNN